MSLFKRRVVSMTMSVALHAAVFTALALVPVTRPRSSTEGRQRAIAAVYVPSVRAPTAADMVTEGATIEGTPLPPGISLPGFEFDITAVRERQAVLFPFLTDTLSALDDLRAAASARAAALTWATPLPAPSRSQLPPLDINDAQVINLVDNAWSRRNRWESFAEIARLVTTHDPDVGRAAELIRTHIDQNLLQPYFDAGTRDPRFWAMLTLAADHSRIVEFVSRFVRQHPSSRASTELLFLLDEFAQASRDALLMLMATEPERDLALTRGASEEAFALAVSVRDRYRSWLEARSLDGTREIRRHYDAVRLAILRTIIATTPGRYGAADARYLSGLILWDQNEPREAIAEWRQIQEDERGMYRPVYDGILRELARQAPGSAARISAMLGADYRHWLEFSKQRLAEFGYGLESF